MKGIIAYCRAGFEKDAGVEIQETAGALGCFGFFRAKNNTGWILFECYQAEHYNILLQKLSVDKCIFIRQCFIVENEFPQLDSEDRLSAIRPVLSGLPSASDIRIEHPDTNQGKELSRFCRKFMVPFRQAVKKENKFSDSEFVIFLFFVSSTHCFVGYGKAQNCSALPLGILRLKQPNNAPSRSTLKLDEALQMFVPKKEWEERVKSGMHAVDLGACPGGWTYQLVRHGMFVQAIDNGMMADVVMETGQVKHYQEDGFSYEPKKKNVTWLVCDMIEKPQRVAELMTAWIIKEWCKEAVFNLKLPMKKRYECVQECLGIIKDMLRDNGIKRFEIKARHLYHDREEVTVLLRKMPDQTTRKR
ncbi:MAG: 23S rRNA (cytidine(2498)-2'-O)-methyltransferase RlmM [Aestuariibacter sp.]